MRAEGLARSCATLPLGTGNAFAHALGVGTLSTAIVVLRDGAGWTLRS